MSTKLKQRKYILGSHLITSQNEKAAETFYLDLRFSFLNFLVGVNGLQVDVPVAYVCADGKVYDATEWYICQVFTSALVWKLVRIIEIWPILESLS